MLYKLSCDNYIFTFSKNNIPSLRVKSEDRIEIQTMDCFTNQIKTKEDKLSNINWDKINPATGPIFVEGAEKGDTLKVSIEKIETESQGV